VPQLRPALAIIVLVVALAGCAPSPAAQEDTPDTAETTAEAPAPEVSPYERTDALPAELETMASGDLSEYLKTYSQEQQLAFQSWSLQKLPAFAQRYAEISADPVDVLPTPSLDNSPAEILTLHNYTLRMAYSLADENGKLDAPVIKRTVYASFSGSAADIAIVVNDAILNDTEGNPSGEAYSVEGIYLYVVDPAKVTNVEPLTTNNAGYPMVSFDYEGEAMHFSYYEFTDYTGQPAAAWVQTSGAGL
jgi:hypothetical protein